MISVDEVIYYEVTAATVARKTRTEKRETRKLSVKIVSNTTEI
jgi:hypothetical protein